MHPYPIIVPAIINCKCLGICFAIFNCKCLDIKLSVNNWSTDMNPQSVTAVTSLASLNKLISLVCTVSFETDD